MILGMLAFGVVCQVIGLVFSKQIWFYTKSLWFGILLAVAAVNHMYHVLDRSLGVSEAYAQKQAIAGYLVRYFILVAFMAVICVTKVMNPLIVFLGYMSLKGAAFLQPITHKLCNKAFHQEDPIPEPLLEDEENNEREVKA